MSPPDTADRLRKQVKSMALLCALLGPSLMVMSGFGWLGQRLIARMMSSGLMRASQLGVYERVSLAFGTRTAAVSIPLGAVLLWGGVRALRDPARGRSSLELAAWISVAAMVAYGVVWSAVVREVDGDWVVHAGGWLAHGVQGVLIAGAIRFLRRADVRSALGSD